MLLEAAGAATACIWKAEAGALLEASAEAASARPKLADIDVRMTLALSVWLSPGDCKLGRD